MLEKVPADEPAYDLELWIHDLNDFVEVGDYIGINYYNRNPKDPSDVEVWTSFTGTFSGDTNPDKSVIWSNANIWP